MRRFEKLYISYSPIISLLGIVILNFFSLFFYEFYCKNSFWMTCFVGLSFIGAIQNVCLVRLFSFCEISKYASYALLIFIPIYLIDYLIFGIESIANIVFQLTVGIYALGLTVKAYLLKYPNCTVTNYLNAKKYTVQIWQDFIFSLAKKKLKCADALDDYQLKRERYHDRKIN